jgi:hypothetical protein
MARELSDEPTVVLHPHLVCRRSSDWRVGRVIELSQAEADGLLAMPKRRTETFAYRLPPHRGKLTVPLEDLTARETFLLDISRGGISLERRTYQTRARQTVILARLDFGAPHRNPDDEEIGVPHLHLYREGFGDKWATAVPAEYFPNTSDLWHTLFDFMKYCNVVEPPDIQRELLS